MTNATEMTKQTVETILRPKLSESQIAKWFAAPNAWVGNWRCPADVMTAEPDCVIAAAQHEVGDQEL